MKSKQKKSIEERRLIGARLKALIESIDITKVEFCNKVGISYHVLRSYYAGVSEPNEYILANIENIYSFNREFIEFGIGEKIKSKPIPIEPLEKEKSSNKKYRKVLDITNMTLDELMVSKEDIKKQKQELQELLKMYNKVDKFLDDK
jgi:transcriptional regulator with XRE-family HTH domain